jgi:hypothetical protein
VERVREEAPSCFTVPTFAKICPVDILFVEIELTETFAPNMLEVVREVV